jgi:hypothetical protein
MMETEYRGPEIEKVVLNEEHDLTDNIKVLFNPVI